MTIDLDARAGDVLAADIVATRAAQRWAAVRVVVGGFVAALLDMGSDRPDPWLETAHLVVTLRETGEEVWRTSSKLSDIELKTFVLRQLDELTVGEFYAAWGIEP